nr:ras-related protein rabb1b [Quercus suber]
MAQPWDYIAKIVSLGDSGSGKSSVHLPLFNPGPSSCPLMTADDLADNQALIVPVGPPASLEYNINNPTTVTTPQASITTSPNVKRDGEPQQKHMKLSLWDTAGQETYKSITRSYFRGASGALLVFDISRRNTFDSVTSWLHDLRQIAEEDIVVILVGNKSDLALSSTISRPANPADDKNKRQVTREEAEEWCKVNKVMQYVETSAKSGENVEKAFLEVSERIYQNIEAGKYDLHDRRSGVKGPGAGGGGNAPRTINLGQKNPKSGQKKGFGCC